MDTTRLPCNSREDDAQKTKGSLIAHILIVIALGLAPVLIISTVRCSREAVKRLAESSTPTVVSPTIFFFTMTPDLVRAGEEVTLTWETDAKRVFLVSQNNANDWSYSCIGGFQGAGSHNVMIENQHTFVLYTVREDALPTRCMDTDLTLLCGCDEMVITSHPFNFGASIEVACSPESWFFSSHTPKDCPEKDAAELESREMVAQIFEGGHIIMVGEMLYVFYRSPFNRFEFIDGWDCGNSTIADSYQCNWDEMWDWLLAKNPERCDAIFVADQKSPKVVDLLGPPRASEVYYTGYVQCVAGYPWNCYVPGPNGLVYRINTFYGGHESWWIVQAPAYR